MLAVGAPADQLTWLLGADLVIANFNSPRQTVLSGNASAIEAAELELRKRSERTKRLPVSGAFHSPAMAPAAEAFAGVLGTVPIREPAVPTLSGRTGQPFSDIRAELAASLLEPVRWIDVVATLEREGVRQCREVGPGRALCGLVRRTASSEIGVIPSQLPEATSA